MSSTPPKKRQDSKFIFEELEERRLFSGGIEGLIDTTLDSSAIYADIEGSSQQANTGDTAAEQRSHEIAFVDASVDDYQQIVDDLQANADDSRHIEVVVLDTDKDGINQISEYLSSYEDLDAVHIIAHGDDGSLQLGNTALDAQTLEQNNLQIALWANSFAESGDILLYGCNLAETEAGQSLISELSSLTLTDVAASTDLTGHASLGGDWALEFSVGQVESTVAVSAELQQEYQGSFATYTVTSLADSGAGSLREAITLANTSGGADTIEFSVAGTITLSSLLPTIDTQITIDGSTAPGYSGDPLVHIDGNSIAGNGLRFEDGADGSVVRALMITDIAGNGIHVDTDTDGVVIQGNWIGSTGNGSTGTGNSNHGIDLQGTNTIIGGTGPNDGNVITNNGNEGINIRSGATGTVIQGNIIGLDPNGDTGSGNGDIGIALQAGADSTTIGGAAPNAGNIISGNNEGIEISSDNNTVQGNYIGTDVTGMLDRGNGAGGGIEIRNGASVNQVGGSAAGEGNVIAGNGGAGIYVTGSGTDANVIQGNNIGTNAAATAGLQNDSNNIDINQGATNTIVGGTGAGEGNVIGATGSDGITIWSWNTTGTIVQGNFVGTDTTQTYSFGANDDGIQISGDSNGNLIGGTAPGAGNIVANNGDHGIRISDPGTTNNTLLGNAAYNNSTQDVSIEAGSNGSLNAPSLSFAGVDATQVFVGGSINAAANDYYRVEFFAEDGGVQTYLGFTNVATDGGGDATFNVTLSASVAAGATITATATDTDAGYANFGNSSTLSASVVAAATDITSGLQVHHTYDAGQDAQDSSGNNRDGALQDNAAIDTTPASNQIGDGKLTLDGTDDYVNINAHAAGMSGYTEGTIGAWINTSDGSQQVIFNAGDTVGSSFATLQVLGDGRLQWWVSEGGSTTLGITSVASINDGNWHHVAVTVGPSGTSLWIDGTELVGAGAVTYSPGSTVSNPFFDDLSGLVRLEVGAYENGGTMNDEFTGLIDDFRIYDRALSASDVVALHAHTGAANNAPTDIVFDSESSSEVQVNTYTTLDQTKAVVAAFDDGGYVIVWESDGQDSSGIGVFAQLYDADGSLRGSEIAVTSETSNDERAASVTTFPDGGFVVAWHDTETGGRTDARVFGADGLPTTADFALGPGTNGNNESWLPSVLAVDNNTFIAVWANETAASSWEMVGQQFDRSGATVGSQFTVGSLGGVEDAMWTSEVELARLNDGGFVATWRTYDGSSYNNTVRAFDADGTPRSAEIVLGGESPSDVAALSDGGFVASYKKDGEVKVTVFDANGSVTVAEFTVNTTVSTGNLTPVVTGSDDGFVVAWKSSVGDGDDKAVLARRFDLSGNATGGEVLVNETTAGIQRLPQLVTLASGEVLAVWESENVDGSGTAVMSRVLATSDGSVAENAANGTRVADAIGVVDPDAIDTYTFSLIDDAGGRFDIDPVTGVITVADGSLLDYESATSHDITVRVTDSASNTHDEVLSISVVNVNEAPILSATAMSPTWTEGAGPVAAFSSTSIDTVESGDLINAIQVNVTGIADGSAEILVIDGQTIELTNLNNVTTTANGYDVSVSAPGGVAYVTISRSGGFTAAAAEALVDGVAYDNTSATPQGAARIVTLAFVQDDGGTANGGSNTAVYNLDSTVLILAVNDAPTAVGDVFIVNEDTPTNLDPLANDTDPENDTLALLGFERVIASYDAGSSGSAPDPTSVAGGSWTFEDTEDGDGSTGTATVGGVSPDGATGQNGWNVTEANENVNQFVRYDRLLTLPDATLASTDGFTLSAEVRMVDDFGDTRTTFVRYGDGTTRWVAWFDLDSNGDLVVELGDNFGGQSIQVTNDGSGADAYHSYEIVYDPGTGTAAFLVDGVRRDDGNWAGETSTFAGIRWGVGSASGQGSANFHSVQMAVFDQSITTANGATVTNNGDGTVNYAPAQNYVGNDSFAYTIRDSEGHVVSGNADVSVVGVADGIRVTPTSVVPVGDETRVNTETAGNQLIGTSVSQAIATDANGNYVVVWASEGQDGSGTGVYAQLFNADGTPQGGEIPINTTTTDDQASPSVAMDDAGNFVVTWHSENQDGSNYGVYTRAFDASGSPLGGETLVNTETAGYQGSPGIAMAPNGDYVVIWTSSTQDPDGSSGIYAQLFNADGSANGGEFRVNTYTTDAQQITSVAMADTGNFVVTWGSWNQDGSNYGVFGQLFDADGAPLGSEFQVNTTFTGAQLYNDVAMLGDGRFVVTYQHWNPDLSADLYMQLFNADGSAHGSEIQVNTASDMDYFPIPSVTADDSGNVTLAWNTTTDGSLSGVYVRSYDWDGNPLSGEILANTTTAGHQQFADVVAQPGGGFIVVWGGNGSGDDDGVFTQRYGLATDEQGGTTAFELVLESAPTADVVIPIGVSDGSEASLSTTSVTFTSANWNIPQTVTVTGVQDFSADADQAYTVDIGPATSTDPNFNGLDPANLSLTNLANSAPQMTEWFNDAWDSRKELTISSAQVADDVSNFPVLITLNTDAELAAQALANGDDIVFTAGDGVTQLAHEIEYFDETTGELRAWVKTDLSHTVDTDIYLYFGNAVSGPQENVGGVWDNYVGVYHLGESPNGTPGEIIDSSGSGNHGVTEGAMDAADSVPTAIGQGLTFDGSNDLIRIPNSASLDSISDEATFSLWINYVDAADGQHQIVMTSEDRFSATDGYEWASNGAGEHFFYPDATTPDGNYNVGDNPFTNGTWHHLAATMDFTTREVNIYIDGQPLTFTSEGVPGMWTTTTTSTADLLWGGNPDRAERFFLGMMDEIRIADVARSQAWLQTEFNNQDAPGTFFSVGVSEDREDSLTDIDEDEFNSPGDSVLTIINSSGADRIVDDDAGAFEGVAVVAVDNTNGQWQYDANADGSWLAFGAVSDTSAVLLDTGALIRFVPNADYNGSAGDLVFQAWDQTAGSNGDTGVDVSVNGGNTAISSETFAASLDVTPVNDDPVANDDTPSTDEDSVLNAVAPGVLANDTTEGSVTPGHTLNFEAVADGDGAWNDGNGTAGYDWTFSNFGVDQTHTTSPTTALPGITAAYQFNGTGGATMPGFAALPGDPTDASASFELWIRPNTLSGTQVILDAGGNNTIGTSIFLDGSDLHFYTQNNGYNSEVITDLNALGLGDPTTEFIQIVGVIDLVGDQIELFVNGSSIGTAAYIETDWAGIDVSGLGTVNGTAAGAANTAGDFNGDIAAVRFYEQALNAAQVVDNYQAIADALTVTEVEGSAANVGNQVTLASGALLTINADGSYSYDPNGQFESLAVGASTTDSFTYQVTDGGGLTDTATVTVTINGVNDDPVITSDGGGATAGIVLNESSSVVTAVTASDADADTVTYSLTGGADVGLFSIDAGSGVLTFDTPPNYEGPGDNSYEVIVTADDGNGGTDTQTITVTVTNLDPIANGAWFDETNGGGGYADFATFEAAYSAYLGTSEQTIGFESLATDTVLSNQYSGSHGVTFSNTGSGVSGIKPEGGTWIENITGYDGSYQADGSNVYLKLDNDDPASPFTIEFATPVAEVGALLGMGTEGSNHSLQVRLYDAGGNLLDEQTLLAELWDASSADQNYETFLGVKYDAAVISKIEILNASNVNYANALIIDQLQFSATPETFDEYNASTAVATITGNVLANDIDPAGGTLTITGHSQGANGSVTYNNDGTFTYTSNTGFTGTDTFTYTISDGQGGTDTATVTMQVSNAAPTITSDGGLATATLNVPENTTAVTTVTASDADGHTPTFSITGGADQALFSILSTGELSFAVAPDFEGPGDNSYEVEVTASDGQGGTDVQTITVNVTDVSEVLTAVNDTYTVSEDAVLDVDASGWFDSNWQYSRTLSFDNSTRTENLVDFPVLVRLDSSVIDYAKTHDSGWDLRFFDQDGTALAHEIEHWDEAGTSFVWVRIPQIDASSSVDSIVMYYGYPAVADSGEDAAGVWSDYRATYHLNENPGATGTVVDSAGNFDASNASSTDTAGIIGNAQDFNGVDQSINLGDDRNWINNASGATLSIWMNADSTTGFGDLIGLTRNDPADTGASRITLIRNGDDIQMIARTMDDNSDSVSVSTSSSPITAGSWHHVTGTVDYSSDVNNINIYVDGQLVGTFSHNFTLDAIPNTDSSHAAIGADEDGVDSPFDGQLDEARIADQVRSADWVSAQYAAMTGNLVSIGAEQSVHGVLVNDIDEDGDSLTVTQLNGVPAAVGVATTLPSGAIVTLSPDGRFVYDTNGAFESLTAGSSTTDTFTYQVTDGNGNFETAMVTMTIDGEDDAPVIGGSDTGGVTEDSGVVGGNLVASGSLTVSDDDAGESAFQAETVTGSYGNLTIDAAGNWSYAADNGQAAIQALDVGESMTDTLTVTTADGSTHDVVITINGAEDAPVIGGVNTGTVAEDGTLVASNTLTITDVDTSDNPISFNDVASTIGNSGYGDFEMSGNTWTYALNNGHAAVQALDAGETLFDSFQFTATDGSTRTVVVTINGAEDAPVLGGVVSGTVAEDGTPSASGALTITDTDTSDNPISFNDLVSAPGSNGYGDFAMSGNTWTYTLNNAHASVQALDVGESLTDSYTFFASDGSTQSVTVTINGAEDGPTVDNLIPDQTATEDVAFSFTFIANTFGDVDTSDTLSYSATLADSSPLPLWLDFDGPTRTFSGTPSNSDVGSIDIRVTADDGSSTVSDVFTLTIDNANDPPVIGGTETGTVTEDAGVVGGFITAAGSLTIADPDVGESSFQAATITGSYGDLVIDTAGTWSYSADNSQAAIQGLDVGESLTDTLTVSSFDGTPHDVVITINGAEDAPLLGGVLIGTVAEDGTPSAGGTLTITDTDTSDNPIGFIDVAPTPGVNGYGDFEITGNTWTYTLNNAHAAVQALDVGESLSDSYTFGASDGSTQTVTITIDGAEDVPVLGGVITGTVAEDGATSASGTLTITDADASDNPVSFNDVAPTPGVNGYGDFEITGNTWTYTLNNAHASVQALDAGESLTDSYTFSATDGSTQTVTITIDGAEDAPVLGGVITGTVAEDGTPSATGALTITDADASDNPIGFIDVAPTPGVNGYGDFEITGNTWTYTLNNAHAAVQALDVGESLSDSYTFSASDGSTQTVTVTIDGAEDAPVLGGVVTGTVVEDGTPSTSGTLTITDADASDNPVSFNDVAPTTGTNGYGSFEITGNTWTYTLNNAHAAVQALDVGESLTDSYTFSASNGLTQTVTVTIDGAEDAPVLGGVISGTVAEDGTPSASGTLTITDADASDNPVSFNDVAPTPGAGGYGSFEITGNTWTYTLNNAHASVQALDVGESLTDSYTFSATDGSTQTVTVTINGAEDAPVVAGVNVGAVTEDGVLVASDILTITDVDASDNPVSFNDVAPTLGDNAYGNFEMAANTWTYTLNNTLGSVQALDNGEMLTDSYTFVASDGSTRTVNVTINGAEDAPTVDLPLTDQTATEGFAFSFTFAANSFGDVDAADSLAYSATLADSSPLPLWLTFDGSTRTFSGTPGAADIGTLDIRVTADDGNSSVYDDFSLTVLDYNNLPVIGGQDAGFVVEDNAVVNGNLVTAGQLTIADADVGESSFVAANVAGALGSLTIDAAGNWAYSADNSQGEIQALQAGQTLVETLVVRTADGTPVQIAITIEGTAEAPEPPITEVPPPPEPEPEPEPEPPPETEAEAGSDDPDPILEEIVPVPQDTRPPPVAETPVVSGSQYLDDDERPQVQAPASIEGEPRIAPPAAMVEPQLNQQIDRLELQVSDDESVQAEYELALLQHIDRMHDGMETPAERQAAADIEVQIVMGGTASLTAGIVSWVLRGGSLLASLMSTVPLLNRFDPLPIIKQREEREELADDEPTGDVEQDHARRVDRLFSGQKPNGEGDVNEH